MGLGLSWWEKYYSRPLSGKLLITEEQWRRPHDCERMFWMFETTLERTRKTQEAPVVVFLVVREYVCVHLRLKLKLNGTAQKWWIQFKTL